MFGTAAPWYYNDTTGVTISNPMTVHGETQVCSQRLFKKSKLPITTAAFN